MDKDVSKSPLSEESTFEPEDTQERQLTAAEQRELERTELRNAMVMDGFQDLEQGLDALASPLATGLIQEESTFIAESADVGAVGVSDVVGTSDAEATLGTDSDATNSVEPDAALAASADSVTDGGTSADGAAGSDSATAAATDVQIKLDDVKVLNDDYFEQFDTLQQNFDGFRLHRVDIYNWSSFNNNVKTVFFGGQNTLMTGDNGAGKSSVIDAITILLYDLQKITFNQAAGAEKGERNLASYVWGYYKNDNSLGVTTEKGLRSKENAVLSIISATFYNQVLDEYVILLQCLSITRQKSSPDRHYYIGSRDFNLQEDVLPVKDVRELGKKLDSLGCKRYNTFREYSSTMQTLFGIQRTKVLDLFYKTISMKSISNISDFVRKQMLEEFSGGELVDDLIERVEDLDQAYRAVEEAKNQVEELKPIVDKGQVYAQMGERKSFVNDCHNGAGPYLHQKKAELLKAEIEKTQTQLDEAIREKKLYEEKTSEIEQSLVIARQELSAQGGDRQNTIKQQISNAEKERNHVDAVYRQHTLCMQSLGFEPVNDAETFATLPKRLDKLQEELRKSKESNETNQMQASVELDKITQREDTVSLELRSLQNRKNNIPATHVRVREKICQAIGCEERDLPFVGELIRVKDSEKEVWERAIEKVLHNYAIALLVTEEYYTDVVHYVNSNDIGMRLVFHRIKEKDLQSSQASNFSNAFGSRMSTIQQVGSNSLVRKLEFREDPRFQGYLRQYLERNFNYVCTVSEQEYRSEVAALMPSGLCKKGARNEKDDRRKSGVNDYVLGWTNQDKLASLRQELSRIQVENTQCRQRLRTLRDGMTTITNKLHLIDRLREISSFDQIDVQAHDAILEKLNQELIEFQRTSDIIATLSKKIEDLEAEKKQYKSRETGASIAIGKAQSEIEKGIKEYNSVLEWSAPAQLLSPEVLAELDRCIDEAMRVLHFITMDSTKIDSLIHEVEGKLNHRLQELQKQEDTLRSDLVSMQTKFANTYTVLTQNISYDRASAWVDFNTMYEKLRADDLPRYLDAFRYKLSTDTLDQFATLHAKFNSDRRAIVERINQINEIMYEVDFNTNHYIRMVAEDSKDLEIQQFRNDIKNCIRGSLDGFMYEPMDDNSSGESTEQNGAKDSGEGDTAGNSTGSSLDFSNFDFERAEQKFLEVKKLIDRFKGREEYIAEDQAWRKKVTDVKYWFDFSASEHSREDDSEVDFYRDSGGKSGGQKEKLAYTVLASSIAYQYRSRMQRSQDRSFRFVIIDEAFGRSSPQSVDYALTLFNKFNLQLLIATPMQKLDVIEKFVNHVSFVYRNEITNESTIVNYELKDYILKRVLREQIVKSRSMGKDKEASIVLPSSKGDVALNVAQVEKIVQELDERIKSEQSMYTGPTHENVGQTSKVNVQVDEEGNLIGAKSKSTRGRKKAAANASDATDSSADAAGDATVGTAQAAKPQAKAEDEEMWQRLQQTGSLMNTINQSQVQSQRNMLSGTSSLSVSPAGQVPERQVSEGQVPEGQAPIGQAPVGSGTNLGGAANGQNLGVRRTLTADELAAAQGIGLNTRNEQGQHLSIDEYRKRQDQERRKAQKQDLANAFDKLMELENYDISQHNDQKQGAGKTNPAGQGDVLRFEDEEPVNFGLLATSEGFEKDGELGVNNELIIDAKSIQKKNRSLKKRSQELVTPSQQSKYKYDADGGIKPSRSLDELFAEDDDE